MLTKQPRPATYVCAHCSREFRRKEHLIRHERSHTAARPFSCNECHRDFARNDVLKRHMERHRRPRCRANRACDRCFVRKSKCDGNVPCRSCADLDIQCTQRRYSIESSTQHSAPAPAPLVENLPATIPSAAETTCFPAISAQNPAGSNGALLLSEMGLPTATPRGPLPVTARGDSPEPTLPIQFGSLIPAVDADFTTFGWDWLMSDQFHLESSFLASSSPGSQEQQQPDRVIPQSDHWILSPQTSTTPRGHLVTTSDQGDMLPERPWPTTRDSMASSTPSVDDAAVSELNIDVVSEIKLGNIHKIPTILDDTNWAKVEEQNFAPFCQNYATSNTLNLPGTLLDHLTEIYFIKFHPSWPILHRATFHRSQRHSILVLVVLMVGSLLSGSKELVFVAKQLHQRVNRYFQTSATDLSEMKNWSLGMYQALLLYLLFGTLTVQRGDAIRTDLMYGMLVNIVRRLGLLGEESMQGEQYDNTADVWLKREEQKRFALAVVKLDASISVVYNRPPTISFEEIGMFLPSTRVTWDQQDWPELGAGDGPNRSHLRVSELVHRLLQSKSAVWPLVEEDYQLLLYLVQGEVWRFAKRRALSQTRPQNWVMSMDVENTKGIGHAEIDSLCYPILGSLERWREDFALVCGQSSGTVGRASSAQMLASLVIWHLSIIRLDADLDLIQSVAGAMRLSPVRCRENLHKLEEWAKTRSGRSSVWHSIEIWCLWAEDTSCGMIGEPLALVALFLAAVVLWAFVSTCDHNKWLADRFRHKPVELTGKHLPCQELDAWVNDGGPAMFQNIPLSSSQTSNLIVPFQQLLSKPLFTGTAGERLTVLLTYLGSPNGLGN